MEQYTFTATSQLIVEHNEKTGKTRLIETNVSLEMSENLDPTEYISEENQTFTKEGCIALSNALIQGLLASINIAHQEGLIDSAQHLRKIISELERGFIEVVQIEKGNFR